MEGGSEMKWVFWRKVYFLNMRCYRVRVYRFHLSLAKHFNMTGNMQERLLLRSLFDTRLTLELTKLWLQLVK